MQETAETTAREAIVGDRFAVDLAQPLPDLDTAGGYAFAARDTVDPRQKVYAVVQKLGVPRREGVAGKLMGRAVKGVLSPRAEGIVKASVGDGQGERMCTVMEFPVGGRVVDGDAFPAFTERTLRDEIVPQIAKAIEDLQARDVAHRAIHLKNLYYRDRERTEVVLGECITAPPGYHTPAAYEPLERALANPAGRGQGAAADDMYALGALVMSLHLGRDVGAAGAAPSFLEARIQQGSYAALGGSHDASGTVPELLRGLLEDNSDKRWTAEDAANWAQGLAARKTAVGDRGWVLARPIIFQGKSLKDRRLLAAAFLAAPREAVEFSQSERFRHWINGGLAEGLNEDWLERALDSRQFKAGGPDNAVEEAMALARLMAVLWPEGPLCFGALKVMPDSIAYALAMAYADGDGGAATLAAWRELMARGRFNALMDILSGRSPVLRATGTKFGGMSATANNLALGQGLERCLYELNKSLPCQSPKVRGFYVNSLRKLALALNEAAGGGEAGLTVFDPHVAAFMGRHANTFEPMMTRLGSTVDRAEDYAVEVLKVAGALQERYCPQGLKKLAKALTPALKKLAEPLKSATRRRQVQQFLTKHLDDGNLFAVANGINFASLRQRDAREFALAQRHMTAIERERRRLQQPISPDHPRVSYTGYRYAYYTACLVSSLFIVSALLQMLA